MNQADHKKLGFDLRTSLFIFVCLQKNKTWALFLGLSNKQAWVQKTKVHEQVCEHQGLMKKKKQVQSRLIFGLGNKLDMSVTDNPI